MTNSSEKQEIILHKTQLTPIDQNDSRTGWERFVDGIRQTIGFKPVYLAERWAEAKVRQEEIAAESSLLAARANYELAMANVRKMDREGQGKQDIDDAVANYIRSQTMSPDIVLSILNKLQNASSQSPAEALENLHDVIQQIELHGGAIEFDLPDDAESNTSPKRESSDSD